MPAADVEAVPAPSRFTGGGAEVGEIPTAARDAEVVVARRRVQGDADPTPGSGEGLLELGESAVLVLIVAQGQHRRRLQRADHGSGTPLVARRGGRRLAGLAGDVPGGGDDRRPP